MFKVNISLFFNTIELRALIVFDHLSVYPYLIEGIRCILLININALLHLLFSKIFVLMYL